MRPYAGQCSGGLWSAGTDGQASDAPLIGRPLQLLRAAFSDFPCRACMVAQMMTRDALEGSYKRLSESAGHPALWSMGCKHLCLECTRRVDERLEAQPLLTIWNTVFFPWSAQAPS